MHLDPAPRSRAARPAPGARLLAAGLVLLLASATAAQDGSPGTPTAILARRTSGSIHLDGRLDEAAWRDAEAFSAFVEDFPRAGAVPDLRTEVRVLFDHDNLYVGVTCRDPAPSGISRPLARRDGTPVADRVEVALDPGSHGSTAYAFSVNAGGVLRDRLLFANVNSTDSWDAVWDAAVAVTAEGWSAELTIPFKQLRSNGHGTGWGILVRREIPRTHQVLDSSPMPRDANPVTAGDLVVSRFGRLDGVEALAGRRGLELLPYAAARVTGRPRSDDPLLPHPRVVEPSADVGLDLKTALGSRLTLTGTVNPDFGQVESDKVIQNLQNSEPFFPEKRPFFLEGLDIFQPVGAEYGSPQQPFYSRRIGLDAPILGAAKVTGVAGRGLEVGVLDALVTGRRPFHLGDDPAPGGGRVAPTNYFAAVARQRVGGSTAGATFTAASPLGDRCARRDFATDADFAGARCEALGGNALALDLNVPGVWGGFAQVEASQAVGGPPGGRLLRDGTLLKAGDLGFGGHLRAGKLGGEPWRFEVQYVWEDAKLDLNQVGFQPLSNYQWVDLVLHYVRPSGMGPFHSFQVDYLVDLNWTADGRNLPRGVNTNLYSQVQLPGYETVGVRLSLEIPQYDTREIAFSGVPFERQADAFVALELGSDPSRMLQVKGDVFAVRWLPIGGYPGQNGWGTDVTAIWAPHPRLETRLEGSYGDKPQGPRWVDTLADGTAVFGSEYPKFLSLTLRQQLVFTPRLSAQLYAQLFGQSVRFGPEFRGAQLAGRRHLSPGDLRPIAYDGSALPSHDAIVNVNAVLRWEYRLGSTLYLVYTRSQRELPATGSPAAGVLPSRLLRGPAVDGLLLKWSYWWDA